MKSMQMKALALAVLGLAGFGVAGSAMACDNTNLSAWTASLNNQGTIAVVAGGLEGTPSACKLAVSLVGSDPLVAAGVAFNDSTVEPTYHFRFYFNQDNLGTLPTLANAQIFAVKSGTLTGATSGKINPFMFRLGIIDNGGSGGNRLVAAVACDNGGNNICLTTPISLAAGNHYVEGALSTGATGTFKLWVDHNAAAASPPAADASITINNTAWGGGKNIVLGLGAHQPGFPLSTQVFFDAFDSRRQTFIGPAP